MVGQIYMAPICIGLSMDCYYLIEGFCRAQSSGEFYKPTPEEKTKICQDSLKFPNCERFKAYNIYIRDKKF